MLLHKFKIDIMFVSKELKTRPNWGKKQNLRRGPVRLLSAGGGGGNAKWSHWCPTLGKYPLLLPLDLYVEDGEWGAGGGLDELLCLLPNEVILEELLSCNLFSTTPSGFKASYLVMAKDRVSSISLVMFPPSWTQYQKAHHETYRF